MVSPVVGRLGTNGWARTPEERMAALLVNYRACAHSQSTIYAGQIKSMTMSQFRSAQDPDSLATLTRKDLEELYSNIFPEEVEVTTEIVYDEDNPSRYVLEVSVTVTENGETYRLNEVLGGGTRILQDYERTDLYE